MKNIIVLICMAASIIAVTQNAMAVNLYNAEDFRIEVTAEPAYLEGELMLREAIFVVDVYAVNNSNDAIDLTGISCIVGLVNPLGAYAERGDFSYRSYRLNGIPEPTNILPHSKVLLQSFSVAGSITIKETGPGYNTTTVGPVDEMLIRVQVNDNFKKAPLACSSVHARYKKHQNKEPIIYDLQEPVSKKEKAYKRLKR